MQPLVLLLLKEENDLFIVAYIHYCTCEPWGMKQKKCKGLRRLLLTRKLKLGAIKIYSQYKGCDSPGEICDFDMDSLLTNYSCFLATINICFQAPIALNFICFSLSVGSFECRKIYNLHL